MEALFGITGKNFVLLAADDMCAHSIVIMKKGEDKTRSLNKHNVMMFSGEAGDTVNFAEYIKGNIQLYSIRNGIELSPDEVAKYTRRELADALRTRVSTCVPRFGHNIWSISKIEYLEISTEY